MPDTQASKLADEERLAKPEQKAEPETARELTETEKLEAHGYAKCFDMPFGGNSPEKHISKGFPHLAVAVMSTIFKVLFRYRVDGRENLNELAEKTGVMVVCNHTSFLDVIVVYLSVRPRFWPRIIARSTLFTKAPSAFGWILAHVGVFPVQRDAADKTAIKRAVKFMKNGEVVCVMPEGARRNKSAIEPALHGGAALMARMAKVPILPMTVRDAEHVKEKGKFIRFPKITSEFGTPVMLEDFDFLPKDERLDGCIWYAMRECFALSRRIPREEVDMPGLFPKGKDYTQIMAEADIPLHTSAEIAARYAQAAAARASKAEKDS